MMSDRHVDVSVSCAVAYGLWALAVMLMGVSWFLPGELLQEDLARLALLVGMVAAVGTVRTYFVALGWRIKAALIVAAEDEQAATIPSVTPLR